MSALSMFGHDGAIDEIRAAFVSGRMPHAWMIAGIEGIGKASLARQIAGYALTGGRDGLGQSDPKHPMAKLIEADAHPDLLAIRRPVDEKSGEPKNIIPVEDALKVASFLHKTATHGGWRVVILDEAHRLNRHGQNAILKIIEEPPPHTLILLTVTVPGALLPTIRSRCRLLQLAPLAENVMRSLLQRQALSASGGDIDDIIGLSGGSVGFALKILQTDALPLYRELLAMLGGLPQLDHLKLHKLADQIARKSDGALYEMLTALLIEHLRRVACAQASGPAGAASAQTALNIWDKTRATLRLSDQANLDRKLAFIHAITDIRVAV